MWVLGYWYGSCIREGDWERGCGVGCGGRVGIWWFSFLFVFFSITFFSRVGWVDFVFLFVFVVNVIGLGMVVWFGLVY